VRRPVAGFAPVGDQRLPARTAQLLYAAGAFGFNVLVQTYSLWLIYFYAPPPGAGRPTIIPLVTLGLVLTLGRILDAIDDPLIGYWSDITRSRWGRRLPFVVGGTPLLALTFYAIWHPPGWDMPWVAVYAFVILQLYSVSWTIVHQPYEAVLAEISRDRVVRLRVSGYKVLLGVAGAAVGLVGSARLIAEFGFTGMAMLFAGIASLSILLSALGIRRMPQVLVSQERQRRLSLWQGLKETATNRQFLVFVCSEVTFFLGLSMLTALLPYFVTVVLGRPEGDVALFTGAFFLVVLLSLPLVYWIVLVRSKAFAYRTAMAVLSVMLPGLYVIGNLPGVDPFLQSIVYIALLGLPMSVVFVLPNPMIADIVDDDETRTGLRRAGMYFGVEETVGKAGAALAAGIFGLVLGTFGFSPEEPLGIRLIGPVAGAIVFLGLVVFSWGYRLPDEVS
jgi:glycoside/pentoside/hexuronide:cation symporter, GPH family